ncbi:MAG: hypothetical protein ACP5RI_00735 [Candidatus Micrarchaeia archaeon]
MLKFDEKIIRSFINKYNLPEWLIPYIKDYLKKKNYNIKYILTFINYGRKKGDVKAENITLPNGVVFKRKHMVHLLNLLYYSINSMSSVSKYWSEHSWDNLELKERFISITDIENGRALIIKNLIEGLNYNIYKNPPSKELENTFNYIKNLNDWNERIVSKEIILNYSYAIPFGYVFYKIFYPIAPTYIRSFGKKFFDKESCELEDKKDAEMIISDNLISEGRLKQLLKDLIINTIKSINVEIDNAKEANIYDEIILLRNIAAVYPLYKIKEINKDIYIEDLFKDKDIKKLLD